MSEKELDLATSYNFDFYDLEMDTASLDLFMKKYREKMELCFSGDVTRKDKLYRSFHSGYDKSPIVHFLLGKIKTLEAEIDAKNRKVNDKVYESELYRQESKGLRKSLFDFFMSSRKENLEYERSRIQVRSATLSNLSG